MQLVQIELLAKLGTNLLCNTPYKHVCGKLSVKAAKEHAVCCCLYEQACAFHVVL